MLTMKSFFDGAAVSRPHFNITELKLFREMLENYSLLSSVHTVHDNFYMQIAVPCGCRTMSYDIVRH